MSKRLVKTAKQQFEERRNELVYRYQYELCETETYYAYEDSKGHFYILREQDGEYKELRYNQQYEALVFGERFLSAMSERFAEHNIPVKPLFDWYASADHDEEPFNLLDIYMCELESEHFTFEDIYEEVPDVKVVTAKEQWEKDSKDAKILKSEGDEILKVSIDENSLRFYYFDFGYYCDIHPHPEVLRKDGLFIKDVTDKLLESCCYEEVGKLQHWVRFGGDFPLDWGWVFYSEFPRTSVVAYEDKEEEPVKKLPDSITEMNMHDPFNWLREADNGTWNWIAEYCNDPNEYGYLDIYYRIINGDIDKEDEFCKDMTIEEIKADYGKRFPLLLAGVFENLAEEIRSGELQFVMDYTER